MSEHSHDGEANYRERVYSAFEDAERTHEEAIEAALDVGRRRLGTDVGFLTRIDDGVQTVEQVAGESDSIVADETCPLDDAYCKRTVRTTHPLSVQDAETSPLVDADAYERWDLGTYVGCRLTVDGETYGTVCFAGSDARDEPFAEAEELFVELVARLVSNRLERHAHELEQARRNDRLERQRDRFESIADTSFDIIYRLDASGRFTYISAAVERILGYDPDDLLGESFADYLAPESTDRASTAFARLVEGEPVEGIDLDFVAADGERVTLEVNVRPVVDDGSVSEIQGVARDVTVQRTRERELRLKSRAIEEAAIGIIIADAREPDNPVVYANPAFEEVSGYAPEEVRGRNCRILQGPETDTEDVATLASGRDAAEPVEVELLNYRKDGTPFWNRVGIAPVEDETGTVTHFVGFQEDVTERKRTQRLIQLLNRVLRHNLRNDMNVLLGYADFVDDPAMREQLDVGAELKRLAEELTDLSEQARELESYAQRDREVRRLEPETLVDGAVSESDLAPGEDGTPSTLDVEIRTDRDVCAGREVQQALAELLTNAVTHDTSPPTQVSVTVADDDDLIEVTVVDDGPGVGAVEARAVRSEEETPLEHGDGLGLWFVNWIVTRYGGSFRIESDESAATGTVATVRLPAVAEDESLEAAARRPTVLSR
jgi:PAS domain S-box-containing protein